MASTPLAMLTPLDIVRDVPHDPAAFVTYALLGLFIAFVWMGNRRKPVHTREAHPRSPHAS